jgi:hypothetical protein
MKALFNLAGKGVALVAATLALGAVANAGILTVTAPADGSFVGASTNITFRISGGVVEVLVRAVITSDVNGATTTIETRVTPDENGNVPSGSMNWSPSQSFPEGPYTIVVSATEPGNSYKPTTIHVTLDRLDPRLFEYSPINNSFISGPINVSALIDEPNIDSWRVTVNDADLPNNTGSSSKVSVLWDPENIELDGEQTVKIIVKDLARNELTQSITVTLDRAAPVVNVVYPRVNQEIIPGSIVTVLVLIQDISSTSVDPVSVVAEIQTMGGTVLRRVARFTYEEVNANTARWVGRWLAILKAGIDEFRLVVNVTDRAGNVAVTQIVPLRFGR